MAKGPARCTNHSHLRSIQPARRFAHWRYDQKMRMAIVSLLAFILGLASSFFILSRTGVPLPAPSAPMPDSARDAWSLFTQRMADLGDRIASSDFPSSDLDRVRLQRHLIGQVIEGLRWEVDNGDPSHPTLMVSNRRFQQWGGPNADNIYYRAHVDPRFQYRLSGDLFGIDHVAIALSTGDMHMGAFKTSRNIDVPELGLDKSGRFSLTIGADEMPPPWLEMDSQDRILTVRIYVDDWQRQTQPRLFLERVDDAQGISTGIDDEELARRITRAGDWIESSVTFWNAWMKQRTAVIPANTSFPPIKVAGGSDTLFYGGIAYDLAPDEALVVEGPMVEGRYWSFQRSAYGSFSTNYADHVTSLNHKQIRPGSDSRFRIVVAHADPGVPNWIDTEGDTRGLIAHRWIGVAKRPDLETSKVRLDQLSNTLPSDTPRVSLSDRKAEIRIRQRQAAWRP